MAAHVYACKQRLELQVVDTLRIHRAAHRAKRRSETGMRGTSKRVTWNRSIFRFCSTAGRGPMTLPVSSPWVLRDHGLEEANRRHLGKDGGRFSIGVMALWFVFRSAAHCFQCQHILFVVS